MAKQRRSAKTAPRSPRRVKRPGPRKKPAQRKAAAQKSVLRTSEPAPTPVPDPAPPPTPRKPGFDEAVAVYERGVQALQRHDFTGAATSFRIVLDRYPEERELLERARLYLRVCERETARQPAAPKTP